MKAIINGFTVECTPAEFIELTAPKNQPTTRVHRQSTKVKPKPARAKQKSVPYRDLPDRDFWDEWFAELNFGPPGPNTWVMVKPVVCPAHGDSLGYASTGLCIACQRRMDHIRPGVRP